MHDSVRAAWHAFSTPFEGRVHSLYCDVLGLITTGVGNLVEPVSLALQLPWKLPDGSLASSAEVARQWYIVKNQSARLKKLHWKYAAELTTIRLTDEDIDRIVSDKLVSNERFIERWFPGFAAIPADAQLAILSMAWAAGPGFNQKFPNFTRSALAGRWWEAAVSGKLRETGPDGTPNPGVIPRNNANRLCFENAGDVLAQRTDPSVLHWPSRHPSQLAQPPPAPPVSTPEQFGSAAAMSNALDAAREATRQARNVELLDADEPDSEVTIPDGKGNA